MMAKFEQLAKTEVAKLVDHELSIDSSIGSSESVSVSADES